MFHYLYTTLCVILSIQHIMAVVGRSESVPTELFKPVEPTVEHVQPSESLQSPQAVTNAPSGTFPNPQNFNFNYNRNPFLHRHSQTTSGDNSNEFTFENEPNRVGTTVYSASNPSPNTFYWYSSGSSPELRAQVEAKLKSRIAEIQSQQQHNHGNFNFNQGGGSSFGSFPSSNHYYQEKSYETTYDSNGNAITKHYEYDTRNGPRTYVTYN